jgi:hypothetical protein
MCFDTRPQSDEAIAAYRKFLTGAQLNETPLGGSYRKSASVLRRGCGFYPLGSKTISVGAAK